MTDDRFKTGGGFDALGEIAEGADKLVGRELGDYRIIGLIAEGGMGRVYRAERVDGSFEREVALKVSPAGAVDEKMRDRFRLEQSLLAGLNHPNIAQLFDAQVAAEAWPYFVMEYVDGGPVDEYCQNNALSIKDRVRLFIDIVDAVAYAHSRLVIHRDIKPSNVLVTSEGRAKLLDFGIAKLLEGGDAERSRLVPLTPRYASPEQLLGQPVTIASDIFQLGHLLYTMLLGRPLAGDDTLAEAIARASSEHATPVDDEARSLLPRELVLIIEQCLRHAADDRYRDANALRDDLQAWLDGYPVRAAGLSTAYRMKKFLGRNRAASAAIATLLAVLIVGNYMYLTALFDSREEARSEAQRASAVTEFLVGIFEASAPGLPGAQQVSAEELLQAGVDSIATELGDQPGLRAQVLYTIGRLYTGLGRYEQSEKLLRESLAVGESAHGANHESLIDIHNELAQLLRGYLQQVDQAAVHLERAMEIHRRNHGVDAGYALLLAHMGILETYGRQRYDKALELLLEAKAIQDRHLGPDDADRITVLRDLMNVHANMGELEAAEQYGRRALELAESNFGPVHAKVHSPLYYLARVLLAQGKLEESVRLFERDVELVEIVYGPDHSVTADAYINLANALRRAGHPKEALPAARKALAIFEQSLGTDHSRHASAATLLAGILQDTGDFEEVEQLLLSALATQEARHGPKHTTTAYGLKSYGDYLFRVGRLEEARAPYIRAYEIQRAVLGPEHPATALMIVTLGALEVALGNFEEAEPHFLNALAIQEKSLSADHPRLAETLSHLGWLRVRREQWDDCQEPLERALDIRETRYPADHPVVELAKTELESCRARGN